MENQRVGCVRLTLKLQAYPHHFYIYLRIKTLVPCGVGLDIGKVRTPLSIPVADSDFASTLPPVLVLHDAKFFQLIPSSRAPASQENTRTTTAAMAPHEHMKRSMIFILAFFAICIYD